MTISDSFPGIMRSHVTCWPTGSKSVFSSARATAVLSLKSVSTSLHHHPRHNSLTFDTACSLKNNFKDLLFYKYL